VLIRDGDEKDFEGVTIPTCVPKAVLFANGGSALLEVTADELSGIDIEGGSSILFAGGNVLTDETALSISGSLTYLTVTVLGEAS
jgi:hypothetical protein